MKTEVQILKDARALLSDPSRWTKGAHARNAGGSPCRTSGASATCFCAIGALFRVQRTEDWSGATMRLTRAVPTGNIAQFNDARGTTHAMVLEAFDKAIAAAEGETK